MEYVCKLLQETLTGINFLKSNSLKIIEKKIMPPPITILLVRTSRWSATEKNAPKRDSEDRKIAVLLAVVNC